MTKTINLVPKIDLLTRNCNLICSFMIYVMKQRFWLCIFEQDVGSKDCICALIWILLTVLCKVFETALFGNLKFIATCL